MSSSFNPWLRKESIVEKAYEGVNYHVIDNVKEARGGDKRCVVFCSSNDLWFPNTEDVFKRTIVERDRYEWQNISLHQTDREIYIRDIYKSWYVTGISSENDSIDKLVQLLKTLTAGYRISTIGISAGGYIAAIIGCLLRAEFVVAFAPQTDLRFSEIHGNPLLQKYSENVQRNIYYNIKPLIEQSGVPVYYIVGNRSADDAYYYHDCKRTDNFHPIVLRSKKHGAILERSVLRVLTAYTGEQWETMYHDLENKTANPLLLSLKIAGVGATAEELFLRLGRGMKKAFDRKR